MTDLLPKWIDAYRKQTYPTGWPKERPPQRYRPKKQKSHYVPACDVENTNYTKKEEIYNCCIAT